MPMTTQKKGKANILKRIADGPFFWIAPLALILICIFVYPTIEVIRYSFTNATLTSDSYTYTLNSYKAIFSNTQLLNTLVVTVIFVIFSVVGQTLLGLIIALAVNKGEEIHLRGSVFVRISCLLSWAIPGVIIGVIWKLMLDESESGILVPILHTFGINHVTFLTSGTSALICTIIANIWRGSAQSMILSYSGLKTISKDVMEAADIDGASPRQKLFYVTLPSIAAVISINVVLNTIATFNTFDMVMSLTAGGPGTSTEVLTMTAYNQIFKTMDLGSGSAYATILLLINGCMALLYFWFLKRRGETN